MDQPNTAQIEQIEAIIGLAKKWGALSLLGFILEAHRPWNGLIQHFFIAGQPLLRLTPWNELAQILEDPQLFDLLLKRVAEES